MKLTKKNIRLIIGCFVCSTFLTAAGASLSHAEPPADYPVSEPLCIYGTIHKEGTALSLTNIHGDTVLDELILGVSDETRILDAANGFPVTAETLKEGENVYAYISQAMALSLPPQSHVSMIICQIPEDAYAPFFDTADQMSANADGTFNLTTLRGNTYRINEATMLLPYLTRNIVTVSDLTKGRTFLVWKDQNTGDNTAAKIVIFPENTASKITGPASDPELQR